MLIHEFLLTNLLFSPHLLPQPSPLLPTSPRGPTCSAANGLGIEDLVVLSGAHPHDRSHYSSVAERIASPSEMDVALVAQLWRQCPASPSLGNNPVVAEDAVTPNALDNQYYRNLLDQ